jgi:hypothetical protein
LTPATVEAPDGHQQTPARSADGSRATCAGKACAGSRSYCLNHACLHRTVINVDDYPDEIEVPSFGRRMKCSKCGGRRVRDRLSDRQLQHAGRYATELVIVEYMSRWRVDYLGKKGSQLGTVEAAEG